MDRRCQILAWGKTREIYVAALVDLSYLTCTSVSHKGGASAAELQRIALRVYLRHLCLRPWRRKFVSPLKLLENTTQHASHNAWLRPVFPQEWRSINCL